MRKCTSCGIECTDDDLFCASCGNKVEEQEPEKVEKVEEQEPEKIEKVEQQEPVKPEEPTTVNCEFCGETVSSTESTCTKCGAQLKYSKQASIEAATGEFVSSNIKKLKKAGKKGVSKIKETVESDNTKGLIEKNKKWIPVIGAAVVVLLVLIIGVPKLLKGNKFDSYGANALSFAYNNDDLMIFTNKKVVAEIMDSDFTNPKFSLSGTKAVAIEDYDRREGGTLYLIDAGSKKEIDDEVVSYVISDNGNSVAYFNEYDSEKGTATLMLYNGKKSTEIEDDILLNREESLFVISPDGSAIAYVEFDDNKMTGYISKNGKSPEKLGKNKMAIALSDKANYIYYVESDDNNSSMDIYVMRGKKETKLVPDAYNISQMTFNKDYSQVIYSYDGKTYISVKGNDKKRLASDTADILLPDNCQVKTTSITKTIGAKSFAKTLVATFDAVYYLNAKFETNKIVSNFDWVKVSSDMSQLAYIDYSDDLHLVTNLSKEKPKDLEFDKAEDVDGFALTDDGKTIYYVNDDEELYSIKKSNKPKKIADDVNASYLATIGKKLFFLVDYKNTGTMFYSTGSNKVELKNADEVSNFYKYGNGIIFNTSDGGESITYGTTNGTKIDKLFEND